MNKKAFTLLELIIVIIIIGVLTSLALPRLFSMVESSRKAEALTTIASIRSSMERYYLMNNGTYYYPPNGQTLISGVQNALDIEDPASSPGAHFTYDVWSGTNFNYLTAYFIVARRNTLDGGAFENQFISFGLGADPIVHMPFGVASMWQFDDKIYWSSSKIYGMN